MGSDSNSCIEPRRFEELVGQRRLLAEGKPLYRFYHLDGSIPSLILYGPPGTGKTSYARLLAQKKGMRFVHINATSAGSRELRDAINSKPVLVVIDEIHRFDKRQQDILLPHLEDGSVVMIGTSTYNPYFKLTKALRSRCFVYEFKPLGRDELKTIAKRALTCFSKEANEDALERLIMYAAGDARKLVNMIRLLDDRITGKMVDEFFGVDVGYDNETQRYDLISAFIKSMRGSDPDAAIYYLARLIKANEDPEFIARRLCIFASEDIGLADSDAITIAASTLTIVKEVGLPECAINLAHCTVYLSLAKKSNSSYIAIKKALSDIEGGLIMEVPDHIKMHPTKPYLYPHNYKGAYVKQSYTVKPVRYFFKKEHDMV